MIHDEFVVPGRLSDLSRYRGIPMKIPLSLGMIVFLSCGRQPPNLSPFRGPLAAGTASSVTIFRWTAWT